MESAAQRVIADNARIRRGYANNDGKVTVTAYHNGTALIVFPDKSCQFCTDQAALDKHLHDVPSEKITRVYPQEGWR